MEASASAAAAAAAAASDVFRAASGPPNATPGAPFPPLHSFVEVSFLLEGGNVYYPGRVIESSEHERFGPHITLSVTTDGREECYGSGGFIRAGVRYRPARPPLGTRLRVRRMGSDTWTMATVEQYRGFIPRVLCALDSPISSDLGPLVDTVLDGDVYEFDFEPTKSITQSSANVQTEDLGSRSLEPTEGKAGVFGSTPSVLSTPAPVLSPRLHKTSVLSPQLQTTPALVRAPQPRALSLSDPTISPPSALAPPPVFARVSSASSGSASDPTPEIAAGPAPARASVPAPARAADPAPDLARSGLDAPAAPAAQPTRSLTSPRKSTPPPPSVQAPDLSAKRVLSASFDSLNGLWSPPVLETGPSTVRVPHVRSPTTSPFPEENTYHLRPRRGCPVLDFSSSSEDEVPLRDPSCKIISDQQYQARPKAPKSMAYVSLGKVNAETTVNAATAKRRKVRKKRSRKRSRVELINPVIGIKRSKAYRTPLPYNDEIPQVSFDDNDNERIRMVKRPQKVVEVINLDSSDMML
jgi:hypothetical protein